MPKKKPNIVCIVADDLGWRDLGCQGSQFYETPNLDQLALDGVRFSDGYASCPVCSPTRASIMTGQYPQRTGVTGYIGTGDKADLIEPPNADHLPHRIASLPECLGQAGYDTWHVGKWHLGGGDESSLPTDHGFDVNVAGCDWGMPSNGFFSPWNIPTFDDGPEGEYLTDRLTDEAIDLVDSHHSDDPFFLNLWYYSVHIPIEAKPETVEKYKRKRKALGLDKQMEFEIGDRFPTPAQKDDRIKRRVVQSDPTYAAMVQHLDTNIGRLLDALETRGLAQDTVVVFTSDNGGLATAEGSPTCNRPLREGKGWMEEGGNRVPYLIRWPGVTDEVADDIVDVPVTSPDVYATVLDAADAATPSGQVVDGESLRPLFRGDDLDRDAVFWHHPHYGNQGATPSAAVRCGDWKLIEFFEDDHLELYHLGSDIGEDTDLSEHCRDRTAELHDRLRAWQEDVGAEFPEENPEFESWADRAGPG